MGNVYDCHSASRSSSWTWCFGEFTFNQESATTISETSVQCNQEIDQGSGRNPRNIRDRLARKSLEKDGFVDWLTGQFGYQQRKPTFLFRFSILYWAESVKFRKRMEGENRLVCQFIPMSRIGSNRRGADGVRVDKFPRIHYIAASRRDPEHDEWNTVGTWATPRTNHLHVNVQRHCMEKKRKRRIVHSEFPNRKRKCKKFRARTLVVSWAWIRKEMVRNSHVQAEWKMGYRVAEDIDDQLHWKWTSRFPWIQCFGTRSFAKQRKRNIVYTFLWWRRHSRSGSSHNLFRQSAQYSRSSSEYVRRTGLETL